VLSFPRWLIHVAILGWARRSNAEAGAVFPLLYVCILVVFWQFVGAVGSRCDWYLCDINIFHLSKKVW
jgi:putative exporter of polyketide antibiotics